MTDPLDEIKTVWMYPADTPAAASIKWQVDWLVGEVERLRGLLGRLEWAGETLTRPGTCFICYGIQDIGHVPGCELAAAIHRNANDPSHPEG